MWCIAADGDTSTADEQSSHIVVALAILSPATNAWAQTNSTAPAQTLSYCVVDTGQTHCFSDRGQLLQAPQPKEPFFGQDAFYQGPQPAYRDNGDGTISDLNTGLMWQQPADSDRKLTFAEAGQQAERCEWAGHTDWRLPTIKEL